MAMSAFLIIAGLIGLAVIVAVLIAVITVVVVAAHAGTKGESEEE